MSSGIEAAIWADQRAGAEGDGAGVNEGGVEVEKDTGAKAHVTAVVNMDGTAYPGIGGEEQCVGFGSGCRRW